MQIFSYKSINIYHSNAHTTKQTQHEKQVSVYILIQKIHIADNLWC